MLISKRSLILGAGAAFIARPVRAIAAAPILRNPLLFPQGILPGLPLANHPAFALAGPGAKLISSGICGAQGGSVARLDRTDTYSITGGTSAVDRDIGPSFIVNNATSTQFYYNTGGISYPSSGSVVLACIFKLLSDAGSAGQFFAPACNGQVEGIGIYKPGGVNIFYGVLNGALPGTNAFSAGLTITVGHPYLCVFVGNMNGGSSSYIIWAVDLLTGFIQQAAALTGRGAFATGTNMQPYVGGGAPAVNFRMASIAVLYGGATTLANAQNAVALWGAAPWDFWYPPKQLNLMVSASADRSGPVGPPLRTLMGVGL